MEHGDGVFSGLVILISPPQKGLIKKSRQPKYCCLHRSSKFGIKRLELFDNIEKGKLSPERIIPLDNCIKITPDGCKTFSITTKTEPFTYVFRALSDVEKDGWVSALQAVVFPDDLSVLTSIEEDNDLYCSAGEGIFKVRIHSSPASERCGLSSKLLYTLILTHTAMQLNCANNVTRLFTWPYHFIRKYGYKGGKFTFEAGRKCDSGEGTFFVEYSNQQEIFRSLALKMKFMKKMRAEDSISSLLECGDNQYHAALSMEARTRSPLPPSPTASTCIHELEHISSGSDSRPKPAPKPQMPSKPPRKNLMPIKPTSGLYEVVDKYDKVHFPESAWRTMGVDDVKHTEIVIDAPEDDVYASWGECHRVEAGPPSRQRSAPIIKDAFHDSTPRLKNYDKLDFFGSSGKINIQAGYKQIAMTNSQAVSPVCYNEYDEVSPVFDVARMADDSHLGYASIRKDGKQNDVCHKFHNDEPYALISKPKRV